MDVPAITDWDEGWYRVTFDMLCTHSGGPISLELSYGATLPAPNPCSTAVPRTSYPTVKYRDPDIAAVSIVFSESPSFGAFSPNIEGSIILERLT